MYIVPVAGIVLYIVVTQYAPHKKVKDIYQHLDLNTKNEANSRNCIKHVENGKISLTFLCRVCVYIFRMFRYAYHI